MRPFAASIECLLFPRPVPEGIDPFVLLSAVHALRGDEGWPLPPVKLAASPGGLWRVADGRHRVIAAMMVGRTEVIAVEDEQPDQLREP